MKMSKIFFAAVLTAMLLTGCGGKDTEFVETPKDDVQKNENTANVETVLGEKVGILDQFDDWSEVGHFTGDTDGDGDDDDVILATSAECDDDGEIMWNDGQDWVLYVNDGENAYVLLRDYVQLGNVYFEVSDYYTDDGAVPHINIIETTGASFKLSSCVYSEKSGGYEVENMCDTARETKAGINRRFTSIPEYGGEK